MKIVQKYGGSSLADVDCVRRVASRILSDAKNNRLLVVVSAQGKTTDALTKQYKEVSNHFPSRESDALLATGEQASAALLAATLNEMGGNAVSLNGTQVPIQVSGPFGDGRIRRIETTRIYKEWSKGRIVIITGFQGVTEDGDIITLGRGGSDTSAVALAAALQADRCMIFTDVNGVYSADPRKENLAVRFPSVHEDTMLNFALLGAKVLHPRSAALAKQYCVPLEVLTSFSVSDGTEVSSDAPHRTGVTVQQNSDGTATVSVIFSDCPDSIKLKKLAEISLKYNGISRFGCKILKTKLSSDDADELMHGYHKILYS